MSKGVLGPQRPNNFPCSRLNSRNRNGITELFVRLCIRDGNDKGVREALQSRPLTWGHLANPLPVNSSFDVGRWCEISQALINDEITFSAHATNDDGVRDVVVRFDFESESVAFRSVPVAMPNQCLQIAVG